eukprot:TRINITY_DN10782_c2_g1_i1.p1 TRINITY_DN10782_c2_g1~~TRINITY_DN10782_c2_g1_i1.p1  ORF type:complete len:292 (-),score=73.08 TRINITY_DN10782_c2_g1_i1:7-831(-)
MNNYKEMYIGHEATPFNTSYYTGLQFRVNPGTTANKRMSIRVVNYSYQSVGSSVRFDLNTTGGLPANTWTIVTIPWSYFGQAATNLVAKGFYIQCSNTADQGYVWLDDFLILTKPIPWPSNWPVAETTSTAASASSSLLSSSSFLTSSSTSTSLSSSPSTSSTSTSTSTASTITSIGGSSSAISSFASTSITPSPSSSSSSSSISSSSSSTSSHNATNPNSMTSTATTITTTTSTTSSNNPISGGHRQTLTPGAYSIYSIIIMMIVYATAVLLC